jgi:hypothetical protein
MNYYLVEFVDDSIHPMSKVENHHYEGVSAISAQEAVNSIKSGWPEAKIWNVWKETGENDLWI